MRQGEVVLYVPLSVVFFQHFGKFYTYQNEVKCKNYSIV